MESFLSVNFGKPLSLSCNDLRKEQQYHESDTKRRHSNCSASLDRSWPRFLRPKSAGSVDRRAKSKPPRPKSSGEFVDNIDHLLADIRGRLAMFRQQDVEFHERLDSLSNSIGELASRSSISLTPSEVSEEVTSVNSADYLISSDDNDEDYEDDQVIMDEIENVSTSFSTEVLNSIPTITVTCYRRRLSDTTIHEPVDRKSSAASSERHSICIPDQAYLYNDGRPMSTLL